MRIAQPPNLRKRPSNNPQKKKSDEHPHKGGTRSDLAKATARGARRACTASASPTTGSPAYETRGNPPADQQSRIQHRITQITPPPPKSPRKTNPLPSSSSRRARRRRRPMRRRGPSRRGDPSTSHRGGANKNPKKRRGEERERGGDGAKRWG